VLLLFILYLAKKGVRFGIFLKCLRMVRKESRVALLLCLNAAQHRLHPQRLHEKALCRSRFQTFGRRNSAQSENEAGKALGMLLLRMGEPQKQLPAPLVVL